MVKVIVCITTYNLEEYIAQAIESVLMQKTTFDYKIVVADDCSTDRTVEILKQYELRFPNIVKVITSSKNLGSLANSNRLFDGLQCEYFSFLDGDDYWIDDNRMQKQIDFLDAHPEYMLHAGNTQYLINGKLGRNILKNKQLNKVYSFEDMLNDNMPFFHTSAIMVRNTIFCNGLPSCYEEVVDTFENCALRGEDFRRILHLEKGPMYASNDVVSVYRIHSKGLWQGSSQTRRLIESAISYNFYSKYFDKKYGKYFVNKRKEAYSKLMENLFSNCNILDEYNLDEKNTFLLVELLKDLTCETKSLPKSNIVKRKLLLLYIRIYRFLFGKR